MIISEQIKAARAFLGWSAEELAERSGIGPATLRRWELKKGVPVAKIQSLMAIKTTLETAVIEFIDDPIKNPGVILHLDRVKE